MWQSGKQKRLAYRRKWNAENREKLLIQGRESYKRNIEKKRLASREFYRRNKQKELDRIRFKKYGISGEEYRLTLSEQGGRCPICKRELTKNPSVDHDHITGKIRGLICNNCNLSIGNAGDSPQRLRDMAAYLEKHHAT